MTLEDYVRYVRNLEYMINAFEYCILVKNRDLATYQEKLRKCKEELEAIRDKYRHYEEQRK